MPAIIVVNHPRDWDFNLPSIPVVSARDYLTKEEYSDNTDLKVYNLCKSYKYQSLGYYVSLLATARNHKPVPDISTIQEMRTVAVVKIFTEELDDLIQKTLAKLSDNRFELSIYFGHNVEKRYDKLSASLYRLFQAPLLRAYFVKQKKWSVQKIIPITTGEIPEDHKPYVEDFARNYFTSKNESGKRRKKYRFDMAILVNPEEKEPPSGKAALQKFEHAAEDCGFHVDFITKEDYRFLSEYDALFIRETTNVNHHTYRFAQRAQAQGIVVIDDPVSILRCSNKVFLAELLRKENIPAPETKILHKENYAGLADQLRYPIVLKQPDSQFSQGVLKAANAAEYLEKTSTLLEKSDLIISQEFLSTDFDWRIGIFNGVPLFACKYFMASGHWQIMNWEKSDEKSRYGDSETFALEDVPKGIIKMALKSTRKFGKGLYGVDLKQAGNSYYLIEVNDNPNIDKGIEDKVAGDKLYQTIMQEILTRVEKEKSK
ncbi:MAG: RimK family protein [Leptospiraceae bacterium]|nr:RimK family protein [Leptospiraceae bacterium]